MKGLSGIVYNNEDTYESTSKFHCFSAKKSFEIYA